MLPDSSAYNNGFLAYFAQVFEIVLIEIDPD